MSKKTLNGAEVLIKCLEEHGVEYIFGYPGGAAIPIFDALVDSKIKLILVRHEQGATHIADGYARATGKPGVVLVTSGPGATNTVTGIITAHMDSVPLIVLTGQTITSALGKDAFQEADVFGITAPIVKHSYLVKEVNHIPRVLSESFYICNTGRPGPVLIDLPKDVTSSVCTALPGRVPVKLPGYRLEPKLDEASIKEMARYLNKAERPLLLIGHGAEISGAGDEILTLVETLNMPFVNTLLGKGVVSEAHHLALGMLGMHGTAYANKAITRCDLILSIGSRWDDRITPANITRFCPDAIKLHIDIDPAEINKIVMPDVSVVGDAKKVVGVLNKAIISRPAKAWVKEVQGNRRKFPLTFNRQGGLKAQHIIDELYQLTKGEAIVTADVGQHQMWAAQFFKTHAPRSWITSGGAGTMGYGFPSAIGAQFGRPGETVIAIVGDGGFQMTAFELSTVAIHRLPVKIVVIDNKYLGMVRQWQQLFYDDRLSGVDLVGNPDFVALAEAYGVKGFRIKRAGDVKKVLTKALLYQEGPCLIHCEVMKEDNVFPMIPAGGAADDMIITPPKTKLEKPKGST